MLSLVVLTGLVGQVSFCQYSFAAIGAFTVGSLVGGHGWSYWPALALGVAASIVRRRARRDPGAAAVRVSSSRSSRSRSRCSSTTSCSRRERGTRFSGGISSWTLGRPSFLGASLNGAYAFYLFTLGVFLLAALAVWNLSRSKTGRVLRAIRNSEIAAATSGVNLTAWKLAAFGVSAGLAGLAGGLLAPRSAR